ncbi:ATP-binding cassette sub-family A member like [Heracleum sosnowskyi]|uniref:ATP-binding cassette sub-family A member like n=1 Tax=Heracleum sosnowskyi TaxID=360622 RepID=A0AAD8H6F4_9APIA|nr:ATP-binding cassette sub-family A member like [Heracleum sosnowskyi]
MDRAQEDMKFLGVFGIYKEGHKVMAPWRKIFNQITLAFILPLCFVFLAQIEISKILFWRIRFHGYAEHRNTSTAWAVYILFKLAYFTFLCIFSLLSTSAVVYTIACIYANREISLKKVMAVVPHVWKRLVVTFIVIYVLNFIYVAVASVTLILCLAAGNTVAIVFFFIFLIIYIVGFLYLTIVWQLASVVTVLEQSYGIKAMNKSRKLIKGKFWVALAIFFKLNVLIWGIQFVFYCFAVYAYPWGIWMRLLIGLSCLVLLVPIFLYGLVLQTIIYFVCKSYHNETIDKPTLSKHLGEYERLISPNEVQLEQV